MICAWPRRRRARSKIITPSIEKSGYPRRVSRGAGKSRGTLSLCHMLMFGVSYNDEIELTQSIGFFAFGQF
jgi:hypothetical protein